MPRTVRLIVSPHHVGIPNLAVGAGPYHIINAGLVDRLEAAGHDVHVTEIPRVEEESTVHVGEIGRSFEIIRRVASATSSARADGHFPVVLAGNCNNTVGTLAGMGFGIGGEVDGGNGGDVVWFDAHPDFDTPDEVETGYFDVNGVAILAGQAWKAFAGSVPGHRQINLRRFQYVGLRDFKERQAEKVQRTAFGGVIWGGKDTPSEGFAEGLEDLLKKDGNPERPCVVHFDVDSLDTSVGIANFAAVSGGLKVPDLKGCLKVIRETRKPSALTIASFDPSFDGADDIAEAAIQAALEILE